MRYLGIDIGGTNIKAALIDGHGCVLARAAAQTRPNGTIETLVDRIEALLGELPYAAGDITSTCLGIPGIVDGATGPVVFAPSLGLRDADAVPAFERLLGMPVSLANDAVCAAMGEAAGGGAGAGLNSFLLLTLGTAVGAALIQDNRPFEGYGRFGGELGHIPLVHGGIPCSCGIRGCFEQYGSAAGLARAARDAVARHPESLLAPVFATYDDATPGAPDVARVFEAAASGDAAAREAVDRYTCYLADGIAGLVNIFRPEAIVLAGGIASAGEALRAPVEQKVARRTYAAELIGAPQVLLARSGAFAGAEGAARIACQRAATCEGR